MNDRLSRHPSRCRRAFSVFLAAILGISICGSAVVIWACNVPVYRYAMAYWEPDPFQVVILHRGGVSEELQEEFEWLEKAAADPERPANLEVVLVDLDEPIDEKLQPILAGMPETESLPWLHVAYPFSSRLRHPAFSAAWQSGMAESLVDSPARREILKRLADGQAAVWVMLSSSDPDADAEAASLIEQQLEVVTERLVSGGYVAGAATGGEGQELLLSAPADDELDLPDVPLQFSLLTVDRDAEDERFLVSMLLGSEADLVEFDSPIVIPVFGRGRSYYALVGGGITPSNIFELSAFLVGSCSCEVKAENPGTDLLFAAHWDSMARAEFRDDRPLPALTGLGAFESGDLLSSKSAVTDDRSEGSGEISAADTAASRGLPLEEADSEATAASTGGEASGSVPLSISVIGVLVVVLALAAIGTFTLVRRPAV